MDETPNMVAMLKSHSVVQAWAGSLDGLLHKDLAAVNQRLTDQCRAIRDVDLRPIGSINPLAPDWQEDVRRCLEVHGMHGVRVHPNYHGYALDHPNFAQFLKLAEAKRLIVMLPIQMEDERVMHPLLRVKPVDLEPLKTLLPQFPELRTVILNAGKGNSPKCRCWCALPRYSSILPQSMAWQLLKKSCAMSDWIASCSDLTRHCFISNQPN